MASTTPAPPVRPSSTPRDSSVSSTSTVGRQKQAANGVRAKPTANSSVKDGPSDIGSHDQHTHDRLSFLVAHLVGMPVRITTKAGDIYSGIFSGALLHSVDTSYRLKMVKQLSSGQSASANGVVVSDTYIGSGSDHEMTFTKDDVHLLSAVDVVLDRSQAKLPNGTASTFRTDTDISGNHVTKERELQPWQPSEVADPTLSLQSNGGAGWDQFETNERLYGVKTDYDENLYTTAIDRSAPSYKQRAAAADRKAREIEGSAGGSFQSREDDDNGMDEEERFSGVTRDPQPLTSSSSNRYTAPARRPPTGRPTGSGAPFDPAIISSQLARPDSGTAKNTSPSNGSATAPDKPKKENVTTGQDPRSSSTANTAATAPADKSAPATKAELTPGKPAPSTSQSRSPGPKTNATETVATDLLESFKTFSANEKMRVQEQQRRGARRDKDVRINDLKKFAINFKLNRPVPQDMLGILAKDEKKQMEIIQKSQQELEESKSPAKAPLAPESSQQQTPTNGRVDPAGDVPTPPEPSTSRGGKPPGNRGFQNTRNEKFQNGHGNGVGSRGGASGTLSHRLQQRYAPGPIPPMQQHMPPAGPAAIRTDIPMPRGPQIPTPNSAASARFNVQATEFKPNPTASMFSPPPKTSSLATSQAASRSVSKSQSPSKRSFFENGRPKPAAEHQNIRDHFNPIKRMKQEVEKDGKAKDNQSNDGIPPAYTTRPTWDVTRENEDKNYIDVLERSIMPVMTPLMPPNGVLPHQHQLPPHLQQNPPGPPLSSQNPHHTPRFGQPQMQGGPRDHHYDDPRMHYGSNQSSVYPSPRPQQNGMHQPPPMGGHAQPMYMQPQFMVAGPNGQMMPYRPGPGVPPQMMNGQPGPMMMPVQQGPPGSQYVGVPGQPQVMYPTPGPGHVYANQSGPQAHSNISSPRPGHTMLHQNSQQGHGPPMMYQSNSQQGQPPMYYMPPQNQQMNQLRGGGYPMQQQGSYGPSPHMQYQQPMQRGGPQQFGNFPPQQQQQMHLG